MSVDIEGSEWYESESTWKIAQFENVEAWRLVCVYMLIAISPKRLQNLKFQISYSITRTEREWIVSLE